MAYNIFSQEGKRQLWFLVSSLRVAFHAQNNEKKKERFIKALVKEIEKKKEAQIKSYHHMTRYFKEVQWTLWKQKNMHIKVYH